MLNIKHILERATKRILFSSGKILQPYRTLILCWKNIIQFTSNAGSYIVTIDDYMNSSKLGYQETIREKAMIKIPKLYFSGCEECIEKVASSGRQC